MPPKVADLLRRDAAAAMLTCGKSDIAPVKVFIICSGVGHVWRGYETYALECCEALAEEPGLDVTLFCGGGRSVGRQVALPTLQRGNRVTKWLGSVTGRGAYVVEEASFFCSLIPQLLFRKPDVVLFSDGNLGNMLWHWRRLTGAKYKTLFSNGGPLLPPFPRWDHIQQVNPFHLREALAAGDPPAK